MRDHHAAEQMGVARVECQCGGSPREMGLTQGEALKAKIQGAHKSLRELEPFRLQQPWWMPYPLFLKVAEGRGGLALAKGLRQSNPAMLARLGGIAEASGLPLNSLCLMNAMEALLGAVKDCTVVPPVGACSALAVRGGRSRSGQPIIARNFDYPSLFQPFFTLRESRPRGKFRSLEFLVAPQAGAVDGVNEKGLAITLNYAFVTDDTAPKSVISMLIAEALATCATVSEAVQYVTSTPRWGAGILMLADASGDMAAVELSNTRAGVRLPEEGEDCLVFTNVCHCTPTREVEVAPSTVYSQRAPTALRGGGVLQPHAERARRIEELVDRHATLGPEELTAVMSDHGPTGTPDGASPCVHTPYFNTTASLQWFPAERSARIAFSNPCQAKYVEMGL